MIFNFWIDTSILIFCVGCLALAIYALKQKIDTQNKFVKLLSQKKSSEILLGQVTEKIAPFLKEFPYDPRESTFLGMPIDYLVFGKELITFIEIKSGNAKLTKKQRTIKQLVNEGKVAWHEINIK